MRKGLLAGMGVFSETAVFSTIRILESGFGMPTEQGGSTMQCDGRLGWGIIWSACLRQFENVHHCV